MHKTLEEIPARILEAAIGSLKQVNKHAVFAGPGAEYWDSISILNAATAGELFIKAIIAKEHPLLIFKDLPKLDTPNNQELNIQQIIEKGKSYTFSELPNLLSVTTGETLPDPELYNELKNVRNTIQHFCIPDHNDLSKLSLEFIYKNIAPLIDKHFGINAIDIYENGDEVDYLVGCLISHEIDFSIPDGFYTAEIDLEEELNQVSKKYRDNFLIKLKKSNS